MSRHQISRDRMVRDQLLPRGIRDKAVLAAMASVPRHLFVEEGLIPSAYEDMPLPIGFGQTISQPYIVALMTQLLEVSPGMRVLEISTGSGYQAAILDAMGLDVYSVERVRELHFRTSTFFMRHKFRNIRLKLADGTLGWPEAGPFDRIIITAGGPEIPAPLLEQLKEPGILLLPLGADRRTQNLVRVIREEGEVRQETLAPVAFVDLVGRHGWS